MNINTIIKSIRDAHASLLNAMALLESMIPENSPAQKKTCAKRKPTAVDPSDELNPKKRACGQKGGLASAGKPKTKTVRRPRGSVMIKDMTPQQKREYWRWCDARKAARKAAQKKGA